MWYSVIIATEFPDNPEDDYGERSFEVQAGSANEALFKAEQQISRSQEKIVRVEYTGED